MKLVFLFPGGSRMMHKLTKDELIDYLKNYRIAVHVNIVIDGVELAYMYWSNNTEYYVEDYIQLENKSMLENLYEEYPTK